MSDDILSGLEATIRQRRHAASDSSYTRQLLDAGVEKCARKFGEEAIETIIAALGDDSDAVVAEAADVVFHLMVLLEARGLSWSDVIVKLGKRTGASGIAEKAARKAD